MRTKESKTDSVGGKQTARKALISFPVIGSDVAIANKQEADIWIDKMKNSAWVQGVFVIAPASSP